MLRTKWMRPKTGCLLLVLLLSPAMVIAESATKYVNVSFSLTSPITLHEPVALNVLIENQASYAISIDLGLREKSAYHLSIVTPDHRTLNLPFPFDNGGWGSTYLKARGKYVQQLLLNEWYPFSLPGDYRILVTLELPIVKGKWESAIRSKDEIAHQVERALLRLKILPRNETVLKERCEALIHKLQSGYEFPDRTPFAEELSYINDPIAIPYLAKLVAEKEELAAIQGLMRIGTDEAMEAMITVTQSKYDKESAASAKSLLRQKLDEIKDPIIRKKVEAAAKEP